MSYKFCFFLFLIFLSTIAHAQLDIFGENAQSTLEVNAVSKNGGGLTALRNPNLPTTVMDTLNFSAFTNFGFELQVKYVRKLYKEISAYTGIYVGLDHAQNSLSVRDSLFTFFFAEPGIPVSTDRSRPVDFFDFEDTNTFSISIPLGARVTGNIFRNDKINFSLGAIFTLYPMQEDQPTVVFDSDVRNEEITLRSNYTLNTESVFSTGLEVDLNYQIVSKKEKFKLMLGFQLLRPIGNVFEFTRTLTSETLDFEIDHVFQRHRSSIYIGTAFSLR